MSKYLRGEAARRVWQERLRKYELSGLSAKDFCALEGISCPSLYQWKKRLGNSSSRAESLRPQFQPVQIVGESLTTVEFPGLGTMRIPVGQLDVVRAVVAELVVASREPGSC